MADTALLALSPIVAFIFSSRHTQKEAIESTYRAPAVVAVWASLRAADPLIMVAIMYLTQRAPSTKKVMAAKAKYQSKAVEGQSAAALPAQGKEKKKRAVPRPPTNAVRSFQYKTYQHSRRTKF